jgi:hypothetical protein
MHFVCRLAHYLIPRDCLDGAAPFLCAGICRLVTRVAVSDTFTSRCSIAVVESLSDLEGGDDIRLAHKPQKLIAAARSISLPGIKHFLIGGESPPGE